MKATRSAGFKVAGQTIAYASLATRAGLFIQFQGRFYFGAFWLTASCDHRNSGTTAHARAPSIAATGAIGLFPGPSIADGMLLAPGFFCEEPMPVSRHRLGEVTTTKPNPMEKHTAQTCRWAQPTMFLPLPYWLDERDGLWSCRRHEPTRLIESSTECAACPRWERRALDENKSRVFSLKKGSLRSRILAGAVLLIRA